MRALVLHGFSGNAAGLKQFINELQLDDCIAIDLPGFGDNTRAYELSWKSYVAAVYDTICAEVGEDESLHIIGHSHGAMVTFCLAAWYPDMVKQVTLVCPVARGSVIARGFIGLLSIVARMVGKKMVVKLLRHKRTVDFVTYFSKRDCSSKAAYKHLQMARRKEAAFYSVQMYSLLEIIQLFNQECGAIALRIPVRMVVADHDILVSSRDIAWYKKRVSTLEEKRIPGGHVAPITQTSVCALACRPSK